MSKKKNKKKDRKVPDTIDPNEIKSRDELMVQLINGATKSGVEKDKKREEDKKRCRKKYDKDYDD